MREPGVRYSIITNEDIENLADKWICNGSTFETHGISGYFEARVITTELPKGASAILRDVQRLRITHRTDANIGDLLFSDAFPGSTIEIDAVPASDASTEYEMLAYLELFTGMTLKDSQGGTGFIDVYGRKVFRSLETKSEMLHNYITAQLTDISSAALNIDLAELLYEQESQQITLRIVANLPQEFRVEISDASLPSEVGLLQRQKRTLQDSEFKGLSAFLPAEDLNPFMVFFDQRLRPHSSAQASFQSTIRGTGSHLTLEITPHYGNMNSTRILSSKDCVSYVMAELPKSHFFDIYELQGMESLVQVRVFGEQDLEKPIWSAHEWGSILLAEFPMLESDRGFKLPFHARYLHPHIGNIAEPALILAPQVFYACPLQDTAFEDNPWNAFTMKEDLIGPNQLLRFYDNTGPRNFTLQLPAANASSTTTIVWMTILTILIGFGYIILQVFFLFSPRRVVNSKADISQGERKTRTAMQEQVASTG